MTFYILTIILGNLLIMLAGFLTRQYNMMKIYQIILLPLIDTAIVFTLSAIISTIIRKIDESKFQSPTMWKISNKEIKLYNKLGIKKWKDKIIEVGQLTTGFSKAHILEKDDPEYLERFILESNYGIIMHLISVFLGLALIPFFPFSSFTWNLMFALPVGFVNGFLHLLPFMVLRYNMPRLNALLRHAKRRASEQI